MSTLGEEYNMLELSARQKQQKKDIKGTLVMKKKEEEKREKFDEENETNKKKRKKRKQNQEMNIQMQLKQPTDYSDYSPEMLP